MNNVSRRQALHAAVAAPLASLLHFETRLNASVSAALAPTNITIPFNVVRLLLPADGLPPDNPASRPIYARNVISMKIGADNKWPNGRDPFYKHETAEIAFGYRLRAKVGDRDDGGEGSMGPGFRDMGDHVRIVGGWRVHKAVPIHGDFFDGVFTTNLRFYVEGGTLKCRCEGTKLDWNGSVVNALAGPLESSFARKVEAKVNDEIKVRALDPIGNAVASSTALAELKRRTAVTVAGTSVVLSIETA